MSLAVFFLFFCFAVQPGLANPYRIQMMGDSITVGYTDNPNWTVPYQFGFRSGLYTCLTNIGMSFQFVGNSPEPWDGKWGVPGNTPTLDLRTIDQDHCRGYGGQGTAYVAANITAWLADEPDIILLMIGINDISNGSSAEPTGVEANLSNIVYTIVNNRPNTRLIIAQITPYSSYTAGISKYNNYIRNNLVPYFAGQGKFVTTVDQYTNMLVAGTANIDASLYANGINHPNAVGYNRMAQTWFAGIQALALPPAPPMITAPPTNMTVMVGQTATFSVMATGPTPLSYQWCANAAIIGGATNAIYTTPATVLDDNGTPVSVVVANAGGSVTSAVAILTVVNTAPAITVQPINATVPAGRKATFCVTATGLGPLLYQWQMNGATIAGGTNASYTTGTTTTNDNGMQFLAMVSNAYGSATSTAATLTVGAASLGGYEMPITLGGYSNRTETLLNFPVLVVLSNTPFLSANGWDLRFKTNLADTGESTLRYEIESWNTNGSCLVWVQVPTLQSNGSSSIWATWGDSTDSNQLACTTNGATWNSSYGGVWHLATNGASFSMSDSTVNINNGTNSAGATASDGFVDGAVSFSGSSSYIRVPNRASLNPSNITVSAWIKTGTASGYPQICSKDGDPAGRVWQFRLNQNSGALEFLPFNASNNGSTTGTKNLTTGTLWHYVAGTWDGTTIYVYVDGAKDGAGTAYSGGLRVNQVNDVLIGAYENAGHSIQSPFNGRIDEVRIENTARSTNWIWACYQTMASNQMFTSYGSVQIVGQTGAGGDAYGIPDGWKIQQFGSANSSCSGALEDPDHDGRNNLQEWLAGTDPTNSLSVLKLTNTTVGSGTNLVILWSSVGGKFYTIDGSTNLMEGFTSMIRSNIPATPDSNCATVSVSLIQPQFFRVRVEE